MSPQWLWLPASVVLVDVSVCHVMSHDVLLDIKSRYMMSCYV